MTTDKTSAAVTGARSRDRSPPFPFISLAKAVERAEQLEAAYKRSAGRVANVLGVWNYTAKSSGGAQTVGALKGFGLLEDEGAGSDRKVKLSDLAIQILKDSRPGKREEALKKAALNSKAIAKLWEKWGADRPPDAECISELHIDGHYTEDAAKRLLRVYDDTLAYAKLTGNDSDSDKGSDEFEQPPEAHVKPGDLVQWEPQGVLQFPEPKRVTAVLDQFVFVEGSFSGLPINEVKVMQHATQDQPPKQPLSAPPLGTVTPMVPGVRQDIWNLDEGPVVLQYPAKISKASYEDLESWVNLQLKKLKRGIQD